MPSMVIELAKSVVHVKVEAWPTTMVLGFAASIAVGAGGGGGGTGVGGVTFFLAQPATAITTASARTTWNH
jgi:hypothetical protein